MSLMYFWYFVHLKNYTYINSNLYSFFYLHCIFPSLYLLFLHISFQNCLSFKYKTVYKYTHIHVSQFPFHFCIFITISFLRCHFPVQFSGVVCVCVYVCLFPFFISVNYSHRVHSISSTYLS